jgi:hypothetical protein
MTTYTLFHGAKTEFSEFIPSPYGAQGPGVYLADKHESASHYGSIVLETETELNNPFYFYPSDDSFDAEVNPELLEQVLSPEELKLVLARMDKVGAAGYGFEVQDKLKAAGHDGIVMVCPWGEPTLPLPSVTGEAVVIAFDSAQVRITQVHKRRNARPR